MGSWYPDLAFRGDLRTLKDIVVGEEETLFIYPDGRNGKEMEVTFTANEDMIDDSVRDMIKVTVTDSKVIINGVAIDGYEVEFRRSAEGRTRTGPYRVRLILSQVRLPIPPLRHRKIIINCCSKVFYDWENTMVFKLLINYTTLLFHCVK